MTTRSDTHHAVARPSGGLTLIRFTALPGLRALRSALGQRLSPAHSGRLQGPPSAGLARRKESSEEGSLERSDELYARNRFLAQTIIISDEKIHARLRCAG